MAFQAPQYAAADAPAAPFAQAGNSVSQTHDDRPQWDELGLRNVLAAGNESMTTAPATPKVQYQGFSFRQGDGLWTAASRLGDRAQALPARTADYYVFCLLKLRL